jgi:alpha-mannosidase
VIRLSAIRGPWRPDPRADEGIHRFRYSIYPHRGSWRDGKVEFHALAFNSPLLAQQEPSHARPIEPWGRKKEMGLPDSYSLIKTESNHVALSAMKQMEGFYDHDAVLRFVELEGREGDVTVELPHSFKAVETNLLEDTALGPMGEGTSIHFHMKPWEIKTVRFAKE